MKTAIILFSCGVTLAIPVMAEESQLRLQDSALLSSGSYKGLGSGRLSAFLISAAGKTTSFFGNTKNLEVPAGTHRITYYCIRPGGVGPEIRAQVTVELGYRYDMIPNGDCSLTLLQRKREAIDEDRFNPNRRVLTDWHADGKGMTTKESLRLAQQERNEALRQREAAAKELEAIASKGTRICREVRYSESDTQSSVLLTAFTEDRAGAKMKLSIADIKQLNSGIPLGAQANPKITYLGIELALGTSLWDQPENWKLCQ